MTRVALPLILLAACAPVPDDAAPDQAPPPTPPTLVMDAPAAATLGSTITVTVQGVVPGQRVELLRGTGVGDGPCPPALGGACASITGFQAITAAANADRSGVAQLRVPVVRPARIGADTFFQAVVRPSLLSPIAQLSNVERVRVSDGSARVRVVHASPDAPAVDVYARGARIVAGASWLDATGYLDVPPGPARVEVRPAGASPASAPLLSADVVLDANRDVTVVAAGLLGSTAPADAIRLLVTNDDWGAPGGLTFRARILHASPDAPTVGVDVGADGSDEISGLTRFSDTGPGGVELPAGHGLQVATTSRGEGISFSLPPFQAGDEVMVIATGRLASRANAEDGFGLLALDKDGVIGFVRQNPTVYTLHASPGAPAVDVQAGGATLVDDLAFRELSAPVRVPPGSYILDVVEGSRQTYLNTLFTPTLNPGEAYLVVATGFLNASPGFQPYLFGDTATLGADPTLQIVHAAPDAPAVEVGVETPAGFVPLTAPVSFSQQVDPAGLAVPRGVYDLAVALPGGPALFRFPGVPLEDGDRYLAVATGSVAQGTFGLTLVDTTSLPWRAVTIAGE